MQDHQVPKYPIVLIHGAGFRDLKWPVYWGRIPSVLEKHGARIFCGLQDCWGSTETNAEFIAKRIDDICIEAECEKVNIIAHSKGGLDARMAVSSFGCGGRVASITTIATPHHGSKTLDRIFDMGIPKGVWNTAAFAVNNWIKIIGDKKPDFLRLCEGFTTSAIERFNRENADVKGIFYQSFACVMSHPFSDINLSTANFVLNNIEGPNDGLVSVESARWGSDFKILSSPVFRGISHLDAIDLRRRLISGGNHDPKKQFDICNVYVNILHDLASRSL